MVSHTNKTRCILTRVTGTYPNLDVFSCAPLTQTVFMNQWCFAQNMLEIGIFIFMLKINSMEQSFIHFHQF